MMLVMTVLTGLIYPLTITGICRMFFRDKADGSLVTVNGQVIGSRWIGQNFTRAEYFQPRPSAAGNSGYDATASGGSNLGPTNRKLIDRVQASVEKFRKDNPGYSGAIPADLLTASGSGLDPHISPAAADAQVVRVATARRVEPDQVLALVTSYTEGRDLGFLGEPRVNVLLLNLELDRRFPYRMQKGPADAAIVQ